MPDRVSVPVLASSPSCVSLRALLGNIFTPVPTIANAQIARAIVDRIERFTGSGFCWRSFAEAEILLALNAASRPVRSR